MRSVDNDGDGIGERKSVLSSASDNDGDDEGDKREGDDNISDKSALSSVSDIFNVYMYERNKNWKKIVYCTKWTMYKKLKKIMKGSSIIIHKRNHPLGLLNTCTKQDELYYRFMRNSFRSPIDNIVLSYCNRKENKKYIGPVLSRMLDSAYFDDITQQRCIEYALICNDFEVVNKFGDFGFNFCNIKTLTHACTEFGDNYLSLANYILLSSEFVCHESRKTKRRRIGGIISCM